MLSVVEIKEVIKRHSKNLIFIVPPMGVPLCSYVEDPDSPMKTYGVFLTLTRKSKFSIMLVNVHDICKTIVFPIKFLNCLLFSGNKFVLQGEKEINFLETTFPVVDYYESVVGVLKNILLEQKRTLKVVQTVEKYECGPNNLKDLSFKRNQDMFVLKEFPRRKLFFGQIGGKVGFIPMDKVVYKGKKSDVSFFYLANMLVEYARKAQEIKKNWSLNSEDGIIDKQIRLLNLMSRSEPTASIKNDDKGSVLQYTIRRDELEDDVVIEIGRSDYSGSDDENDGEEETTLEEDLDKYENQDLGYPGKVVWGPDIKSYNSTRSMFVKGSENMNWAPSKKRKCNSSYKSKVM